MILKNMIYIKNKTFFEIEGTLFIGSLKNWKTNVVISSDDASSIRYRSIESSPHRIDL